MTKRNPLTPLKTYNAKATQAAILDAAEEEFAKHGLAAAHTEVIATKSGATKTMIYYYFQNKEGLYLAMLKRAFVERFQEIQALNLDQLAPDIALEQFLHYFLSQLNKNPNLPMIMLYEAMQNQGKYHEEIEILEFYRLLSTILKGGVASGVFRPLDPQHMAVNLIGTCVFYFCAKENIKHLWEKKRLLGKEMLTQHQQEAIRFVLAGVRA